MLISNWSWRMKMTDNADDRHITNTEGSSSKYLAAEVAYDGFTKVLYKSQIKKLTKWQNEQPKPVVVRTTRSNTDLHDVS